MQQSSLASSVATQPGDNTQAAMQAKRATMAPDTFTASFRPGHIGFKLEHGTNTVIHVDEGGQADRVGVRNGMRVVSVAGNTDVDALRHHLQDAENGRADYPIAFRIQEAGHHDFLRAHSGDAGGAIAGQAYGETKHHAHEHVGHGGYYGSAVEEPETAAVSVPAAVVCATEERQNGQVSHENATFHGPSEMLQTLAEGSAPTSSMNSLSLPRPSRPPESLLALVSPLKQNEYIPLVSVGSATLAGHKESSPDWSNQDAHISTPLGHSRWLVGVFDGHGTNGEHIAADARDFFAEVAPRLPSAAEPGASEAIARLFRLFQEATKKSSMAEWSGTTATIALLDIEAGTACLGHVGDSRLVIVTEPHGLITFQTTDHIVDDAAEAKILQCGGEVRQTTVSNVSARRIFLPGSDVPGLGMTRALGDTKAKHIGVSALPDITIAPLTPGSALVLATDGVWDRVSIDTVAAIALQADADAAAKEIVGTAKSCWSAEGGDCDDITAVVVRMPFVPVFSS
jgi:serine/threonine protein phosphatase PrpC